MTGKDLSSRAPRPSRPDERRADRDDAVHRRATGSSTTITRAEAQRGQQLAALQSFAVVLDNKLYSFPTIDYTQYGDGIDPTGTGAEISGIPTMAEAQDLASCSRPARCR